MRPCGNCENPNCRFCWLYYNDPAYNKFWGGDGKLKPSLWKEITTFTEAIITHAATGFEKTTEEELQRRKTICNNCSEFNSGRCNKCGCFTNIKASWQSQSCPLGKWNILNKDVKRNLIYYIYPKKGNGVWEWNVEQIIKRISLFNGEKIIAIASGEENTTDFEEVEDKFKLYNDIHFIRLGSHNHTLSEVAVWTKLWEKIKENDIDELNYTFYAHAKGVTKPKQTPTIENWTKILLESNLDYYPLVEGLLQNNYNLVSSLKVGAPLVGNKRSKWYYAGSFYWVKTKFALEKDKYKNIDYYYCGTEAWPGVNFSINQGACLFEGSGNHYDENYMSMLWQQFILWKEQNKDFTTRY